MTRKTVILSLAALSLAITPLASASADNTATVFISPNFSGGSGPFTQSITQPGSVTASGSATGGFNSSGSAVCHVDYGLIQSSGEAFGSLNAISGGIFRDSITITSPGVPMGTQGTLTYSVFVHGSVNAWSGSSGSTWHLQADFGGGAFDINKSGTFYGPDIFPPGYTGDPMGTFSATIAFQYGFASPLDVELTVTAQAANSGNGTGAAAYGAPFTLNWAGISNVKANGSLVGSYTATSQSGTDWTNSISSPCPADLNADGEVDGADLGALLGMWGGTGSADLNADGTIDGADLGALLGAWGSCPA